MTLRSGRVGAILAILGFICGWMCALKLDCLLHGTHASFRLRLLITVWTSLSTLAPVCIAFRSPAWPRVVSRCQCHWANIFCRPGLANAAGAILAVAGWVLYAVGVFGLLETVILVPWHLRTWTLDDIFSPTEVRRLNSIFTLASLSFLQSTWLAAGSHEVQSPWALLGAAEELNHARAAAAVSLVCEATVFIYGLFRSAVFRSGSCAADPGGEWARCSYSADECTELGNCCQIDRGECWALRWCGASWHQRDREAICEGHTLSKQACLRLGCCQWDADTTQKCWAGDGVCVGHLETDVMEGMNWWIANSWVSALAIATAGSVLLVRHEKWCLRNQGCMLALLCTWSICFLQHVILESSADGHHAQALLHFWVLARALMHMTSAVTAFRAAYCETDLFPSSEACILLGPVIDEREDNSQDAE